MSDSAPHSQRGDTQSSVSSRSEGGGTDTHPESSPTDESGMDGRSRRALTEPMDVSLLRRGGLYEVRTTTGIYQVDVIESACTCPDYRENSPPGGCKHFRRVHDDLQNGRVPRPDGKLPVETQGPPSSCEVVRGTSNDIAPGERAQTSRRELRDERSLVGTQVVSEMHEREEQIARIDAELQALQFVYDVLARIDAEEGFDVKRLRDDEVGPASQL